MLAKMTQAEKLQMVQGGVTTNLANGGIRFRWARRVGCRPIRGWGFPPCIWPMAAWAWAMRWDRPPRFLRRSPARPVGTPTEAAKYGTIIGTELADYGINVNLGGNINLIGREPRDGRTFETKGEDPILAGKITAAHLTAIQAQHVIAGIKHFAFNDQETRTHYGQRHHRRARRHGRAICWPSRSASRTRMCSR